MLFRSYIHGYWEEFTGFMRSLFNATFKTNPYLERAVMTGITRVSKESLFSDLNNLRVVTTTSDAYRTCFGFTEKEVFTALDSYGKSGEKENVKKWYDGFVFGSEKDIYNPWSITEFLKEGRYQTYWHILSFLQSYLKVALNLIKIEISMLNHKVHHYIH